MPVIDDSAVLSFSCNCCWCALWRKPSYLPSIFQTESFFLFNGNNLDWIQKHR